MPADPIEQLLRAALRKATDPVTRNWCRDLLRRAERANVPPSPTPAAPPATKKTTAKVG